ncbi:MAG TPA: metallophosphoesterase [Planctomycetes bacterium]|nr:metallophosphoesterase [Planctomycetota bacterium]
MIALISDIHGNTAALNQVLDDAKQQGADRFFCLGDVVGYGPEPRECLLTIMDLCEVCLMGNHEQAAMFYAADFNPKARQAIEWTKNTLNSPDRPKEENFRLWNYLDKMPERYEEGELLLVHGSPRDPIREYMLPSDAIDDVKMKGCFAKMGGAAICFVGHSHVPGVYEEGGGFLSPQSLGGTYERRKTGEGPTRIIVNIGSVGQPRDGDPRASYVLFDGDKVHFRRVAYDVEATVQKIRETSLPEYLADRLIVGR